ncbi:hypothetical protein OROMI_012455 [Orobanche minor]
MANIYVRGITKETSNKIVTVKIFRLWISIDQQKNPVSIEAILMDNEGSKIPAYMKRGLLSNFKKQLIEGETVNIANFGVEGNNQSKWTKSKYFIDIIGRIIRVGRIIYVDKAHAQKLDIEIQDESLKVVLWESHADKLLEVAPTNDKLEDDLTMKSLELHMKKKMSGNDSVSRSVTLMSDIRTLKSEEWLNMNKHRTTSQIKKSIEIIIKIYEPRIVESSIITFKFKFCIYPEFRLKVIATSSKSNDDITVVLFENMVANLISKSDATDGDEEALPMDFQPIIFKDYLIRIRVSREYNIVKGYNDYSVEHLTADKRIIGEYCSLAMNELRDIYGKTTTSNKALYSRNMDEDYKIVPRFNKINRRFMLSMRRHLKSHPSDYFMCYEDPRGYRIKIPPSVEECMPLAEKCIEQLLDKYTLNEIRVMNEEPLYVDMLKESRKSATKKIQKKIHEKKDIIARRNSGILLTKIWVILYACGFCGARMWFDEKLKKSPLSSPKFGLCCGRGKIQLPLLKQPHDLLQNMHTKSRNYIGKIRAYNMMYAFTSLGRIQDKTVNNGHGPYTYKLGGNNYHLLGSLLPKEGDSPKFSQLYMYCGEDETQDTIDVVRSKSPAAIDPLIVDDLKSMNVI